MADGGRHLSELLDRVADLLIEYAPIGDYDDGIEHRLLLPAHRHELMGQPGNGVALSAAS